LAGERRFDPPVLFSKAISRKLARNSLFARLVVIRSEARHPQSVPTARVSAIRPGFVIPNIRKRLFGCIPPSMITLLKKKCLVPVWRRSSGTDVPKSISLHVSRLQGGASTLSG
jgi:hypothetical protein